MAQQTCRKCGCPARGVVVVAARVRCLLNDDGTPGRVLSVSRESKGVAGYECGGGHYWEAIR